jgi:hypothetical protein
VAELRVQLDKFEARYGIPSARLADAFRDQRTGELKETEEFHAWAQRYAAWELATKR